jgi:hypothetical protein
MRMLPVRRARPGVPGAAPAPSRRPPRGRGRQTPARRPRPGRAASPSGAPLGALATPRRRWLTSPGSSRGPWACALEPSGRHGDPTGAPVPRLAPRVLDTPRAPAGRPRARRSEPRSSGWRARSARDVLAGQPGGYRGFRVQDADSAANQVVVGGGTDDQRPRHDAVGHGEARSGPLAAGGRGAPGGRPDQRRGPGRGAERLGSRRPGAGPSAAIRSTPGATRGHVGSAERGDEQPA